MNARTLFALAAIGLLATTALATVAAEPGNGSNGSGRPDHPNEDQREANKQRAEGMKEKAEKGKEMREAYREHCADPANETVAKHCKKIKEIGKEAMKARREGAALQRAIRAHELQIGRLEVRIDRLQHFIASGNLTAENATKAQEKIDKMELREDRILEKVRTLEDKLMAIKAKWQEVRDHLKGRHDDAMDNETDTSDAPASSSASATTTGSA